MQRVIAFCRFGHPPWQAGADRGVHSPHNKAFAKIAGVKRISLPQPGRKSPERLQNERQRWLRRGRRFHVGVEGRISVMRRKHGLDCCREPGKIGFLRRVGWGVIANDLSTIGRRSAA